MPDRLPLAAKLPFAPSSLALAMRKAKQLRLRFPSLSLGRARETYARVIGFKDWHAMEQAIAALQPPGVADDLLTPAELRARKAWQIQAASTFAELPEDEIASFLAIWNPTGPARSKSGARTMATRVQDEPVRLRGPLWERAQTYHEAVQLEELSPEQRVRLELMPWPAVRTQFVRMAQALEAETGLSPERCRLLTAKFIDRNLPLGPTDNLMHLETGLDDEILDAALDKFEALGVYQALVSPNHLSGMVAKLRETAKLPEVTTLRHRAEGFNSSDIGIGIHNFLAQTVIPEKIESAGTNQLEWLDKAWHSLKTELGEERGARAWSAMTGLPPSALEYVRAWAEHAPGRVEGRYDITQERYLRASKEFQRRLRDAGIFSQEPLAQEETTLSRWLRPAELAGFMEGIDKDVLDHGPCSVSMPDAVSICRDTNAAIQLSMTLARVNIGDIRVIYVHSVVCDATAAKKLFRAGWPFAYMSALDSEVADAIRIQADVSVNKEAYQLHSRKMPTLRF